MPRFECPEVFRVSVLHCCFLHVSSRNLTSETEGFCMFLHSAAGPGELKELFVARRIGCHSEYNSPMKIQAIPIISTYFIKKLNFKPLWHGSLL